MYWIHLQYWAWLDSQESDFQSNIKVSLEKSFFNKKKVLHCPLSTDKLHDQTNFHEHSKEILFGFIVVVNPVNWSFKFLSAVDF